MNMDIILSAASDALVNILLAVITLGGAYALYYLKLGAAKMKAQTAQIEDEQARQLLETPWTTCSTSSRWGWARWSRPRPRPCGRR